MRIEQQSNYQECGICCMAMLISHYEDTYISKNDVHNICNVNPNGLSLHDIETLGAQNNLLLESYECNWDEIFNTKPKNPFILVVKNNIGLHYVVGKYKNNKIYIFDPLQKNKRKYTLQNKIENFCNIFISTSQSTIRINKEKIINDKQVMKHFSLVYFWKIFIFSILILALNLSNSFCMSILFNKISNKDSSIIILSLCLVVIIIILLNSLCQYFMSLIKQKHIKKIYLMYLNIFTDKLKSKHIYFYKSISKSFFINYYTILKEYLVFYIDFYIELSINFILLFLCFIVVTIINPWILIIFLLINILSFIIKWIYKKHLINKEQNNIQKFDIINNQLINLFEYNKNNFDLEHNNQSWDNILTELKKLEKIDYNYSLKSINLNFINSNYVQIISMFIYISCAIFTNYNIASLVFSISLLGYMNSSSTSLIDLIINKKLNRISEEILQTLLKNNNLIIENGICFEKAIELEYKLEKKIFKNNLFIKFNDWHDPYEFIIQNLYLNGLKLKVYENIYQRFIYYSFNNIDNKFDDIWKLKNAINIELRNDFINYYRIVQKSKFNELTIIQKMLIILFSCTNFKNKIIALNFSINIDSNKYEYELVLKLLNFINSHNFVLFINEQIIDNYSNNFILYE